MLKFLLAAAIIGSLGGAGGGTLAATLHRQASSTKAANVQIALAQPGSKNMLAVPGVSLAAGDSLQRPFDLANSGGGKLTGILLSTTASPSSGLDTDPINGLQLRIDRCTKGWKQAKNKKPVYTCAVAPVSVVAPRPVIGTDIAALNLGDLLLKKTKAHLLLTLTLPPGAPNSLQGQVSSLTYTFTGVGAATTAPART